LSINPGGRNTIAHYGIVQIILPAGFMTKKEWQQYSYLPPVHLDIGIAKPPTRRRSRRTKPDTTAVFDFKRQKRAVIYNDGQEPDWQRLTDHQRKIYRGVQYGEEKEAAEWKKQDQAERLGLTKETFYLDQEIQLEKRCGCGRNFVRQTNNVKFGRGKRAGLTRLLVNEYCPSCGFTKTGQEYHFWVSNSQIVRRE